MFGTILSLLSGLAGIVSSILRRKQQVADQQTGTDEQRLADVNAVVKEAQNAQRVDQDVEGTGRSALIDELSGGNASVNAK